MLLPASGEQIKKLGERLASGNPISVDDDRLLEELVACHVSALQLARSRLDGLAETVGTGPLHISARAKTTGTIIEKLRREHKMSLARMGDLAGFRIVGPFDYDGQDRLFDEICRRFPADPRAPKRVDRRVNPSQGYRALHAQVSFDGVNIEVQIRTVMQHVWADLMERLADRLGRQIRYGESPTPPAGMSQRLARGLVNAMMEISEDWASDETPSQDPVDLDALTEDAWTRLRRALDRPGIDA